MIRPSEILKKRVAEKGEVSALDIEAMKLWLDKNVGLDGSERCKVVPGCKLAQAKSHPKTEEEIREMHDLQAEANLVKLLLSYPTLPFNSSKYDPFAEILRAICRMNGMIRQYELLLLSCSGDDLNGTAMSNFVIFAESFLKKDPDQIVGMMMHEIAHLEKDHMFKWLQAFFAGQGRNDLLCLQLGHDVEADACSVDYLLRAGHNPAGMLEGLRRKKEQFGELSDSHFGGEDMKKVAIYFTEYRIENLEKILAGLGQHKIEQ